MASRKNEYSKEPWGFRVRKFMIRVEDSLSPYVSVLIPNFRVAHYCYVIGWVIIGSIFIYPVKNIAYIDALFFASGAATQSGLNTVDVNKLALWQQMSLLIITMLTTPIFIHGSLLFFRLYSFEKYFDNIKETSKLNHKMRRTATLGSRTRSYDLGTSGSNTRVNTNFNLNLGRNKPGHNPTLTIDPITSNKDEKSELLPSSSTQGGDQVDHMSEPSDIEEPKDDVQSPSDLSPEAPPISHIHFPVDLASPKPKRPQSPDRPRPSNPRANSLEMPKPTHDHTVLLDNNDGIKFADLPQPTKRDKEVDPSEMYRSIELLQNKRKPITSDDDDDEEVLVIKSPNQIENEGDGPIYTRKTTVLPQRIKFGKKVRSRFKKMRSMSMNLLEDENDSINSDEDEQTDDSEFDETHDPDADEEDNVQKALSHLALPSADHPRGRKIHKRYNSLDPGALKSKTQSRLRQTRTKLGFTRGSEDEDNDSLFRSVSRSLSNQLTRTKTANYLSWEPTIGRNSNFVHLSDEQKEELGGVEYRAIKLLIKIVWSYYIGFHVLAIIIFLPWILTHPEHIEKLRSYGISPTWWAFFSAQSCFNDLGYTLNPTSFYDYSNSTYVLIWGAFFIIIGNTGFPVLLRFIIWILYKFAKPMSLFEESLGFLLDHPRRCFTLLFPSGPTWLLFGILIILNGIDLIFFVILDLHNKYLEVIPTKFRIACGFFNAVSTRTAGLSVLDISKLHTAVQVGYLIMMYISVLPIAISIRRTNVYEEQSLGVYIKDDNLNHEDDVETSPTSFIGSHLRNQLSFDLWFVFLGLFLICIAENSKLEKDDIRFTAFSLLFECVSGYGTVGLSLGYPTQNTSLSGKFTVVSKLILIAMMIRGRHRGLPYTLDRAIMLPNGKMFARDKVQENHALKRQETLERANTQGTNRASVGTGSDLFKVMTRRGNEMLRRRRMSSRGPTSFM